MNNDYKTFVDGIEVDNNILSLDNDISYIVENIDDVIYYTRTPGHKIPLI